ncbi:FAD-binding oxidoreductase [Kibdelosporangium persicum]|uniref:D-amino acid dehydrogenase small subunit n=1 Tax=Kibdelosporangium persicum TaxID=2698649 RepID=A0ABX2FGV7_9PSEU|nr:FAD-dependent oxidoreductase [Kibdelosporangium persicum]NRN70473.1 D-amino acid dehydrogenase small subunit [Kibdelosporangium persicum]
MRVIVVGGGIVGAVAAYRLAAEGAEVLVVDAEHVGQATAAGAGVVSPWPVGEPSLGTADFWWAAAAQYPVLLGQLASDGEPDPGYTRVGAITIADDESGLTEAATMIRAVKERDPSVGDIEMLPPGEPARRFPALSTDLAGLFVSGVGRVDGRVMRDSLLRAAERYGARRIHGEAKLVTALSRVTGVEVRGEVIGAHVVVVAAGAWTATLCQAIGVEVPVEPQRGQIAHLRLSGVETSDWPVIRSMSDHYLLAFPGGTVVAGATREFGSGFDHRLTAGGVHKILSDALRVAPGLADATLAEVRIGFRPLSTSGRPEISSPVDGLVIATGLGPSGLTLAPLTGTLAAELALGRQSSLASSDTR